MAPERIAIVGAGLMGHGLAQVFAVAGHDVAIHDARPEAIATASDRIAANLQRTGGDPAAAQRVAGRGELADAVGDADFVFEAIAEDVDAKRALFTILEEFVPDHAVLASNSSVMPISDIAGHLATAQRTVGTHWWNPPHLVPCVEVVQGTATSADTVTKTIDLLKRVGKEPVHVLRDVPGFVGNRLQHALWREAIALVAEGVCDAATVDRVVTTSFGPRLSVMGPMENADYVGLDLTLAIHDYVLPHIDRTPGPSRLLRELVDRGDLGMKTGHGFQEWPDGAAESSAARLLSALSGHTDHGRD